MAVPSEAVATIVSAAPSSTARAEANRRFAGRATAGSSTVARAEEGEVRPTEARDRVDEDDDVDAELDEALRALDGEVDDGDVVLGAELDARDDDLALDGPAEVGDLLRARRDEDHHEVRAGLLLADALGELRDERGLA